MRFIPLFKKALIENFRDWKIFILTVTFAPFFVVLMYLYFGNSALRYDIVFVNNDRGTREGGGIAFNAGDLLIAELEKVQYPDGSGILNCSRASGLDEARERIKNRSADLVVEIPEDFSRILRDYIAGEKPAPAAVRTYGDPSNPKYVMAAAWSDSLAFQFTSTYTEMEWPIELETESISDLKSLNDFALYVPVMLALAIMMLMFTAAATLIKEKDKGTITRLRISNMTTFEWLSAVSLSQVIIGLLAVGTTYATAAALGYRSTGSLGAVIVVGIVSCLSLVALSLWVAAWLRTIFDLMTIGCFPFFVLMFFSGGMLPLPTWELLTLGGRSVHVNDILPTTHSIAALGKILNHGAGLHEIGFEIAAIVFLSVLYFAGGIWLFTRRHMRTR